VSITSPTKPKSSIAKPGDAGKLAHTFLQITGKATGSPMAFGPPFSGFGYETPESLACVYGLVTGEGTACNPNNTSLDAVHSSKGSQYIVIVDAYDSSATISSDLSSFSAQFGLPQVTTTNFQVWYATYGNPASPPAPFAGCNFGATFGLPTSAAGTGWDIEESLDVEMAHSMAPGATIILLEAQSNSLADLACAESLAYEIPGLLGGTAFEVSNSWGSGEYSGETGWDTMFTAAANAVYLASSGDSPGVSYPSASPYVISAGGSSISRNPVTFDFEAHSVWDLDGGGPSAYESLAPFQSDVPGSTRDTPDISFDANPNTGVWMLNSSYYGLPTWFIVGGTSVASPALAGIINSAGAFAASTEAEGTAIYGRTGVTKISTGHCGPYNGYAAASLYNYCTGVGDAKGFKGK
jgi:subtilase family serine protease